LGEEYLLPFVYKRGKQFHVHVKQMNDRQLKTAGLMLVVEKDSKSKERWMDMNPFKGL